MNRESFYPYPQHDSGKDEVGCSIGPGTFSMVFLVFLVLKLTNLVSWDWIWVVSPLWIPFCIGAIFIFFYSLALGFLMLWQWATEEISPPIWIIIIVVLLWVIIAVLLINFGLWADSN